MRTRVASLVEMLGASLWFLPTLLVAAGAAAALALVQVDRSLALDFEQGSRWVFVGSPEGARSILSQVATSVMTVVGVTFSVTVVTLTLVAQQFTPLVIRQFTKDRGNQVVLGGFLATFTYSLLVLRTIRSEATGLFVPQIAVTGGMVLALASVGLLIYFIHHIASDIQPTTIIDRVAGETQQLIDRLFPEPLGEDDRDEEPEPADETHGPETAIEAESSGYLQSVETEALMRVMVQLDLRLRMDQAVGNFIPRGERLATVWHPGDLDERTRKRLCRAFTFGPTRTLQQDPEFGVIQITAIAVKALSPSVNDPSTAIICIHRLVPILRQMGTRALPSRYRRDGAGRLRVIATGTDFSRLVGLAFDPVRRYGAESASVMLALLDAIHQIADAVAHPGRRATLRHHARHVAAAAEEGIPDPEDRRRVAECARQALRLLGEENAGDVIPADGRRG